MIFRFSITMAILLALVTLPLYAGDLKSEFDGQLKFVEGRILSLEDAVPQEKYTWRPADGVRSLGEVYMHVASGNYYLLKIAGVEPPADAGWSMEGAEKWETSTTDKKEIAQKIKASFDHLKASVAKMSDADMEKAVDFFGNKTTVRNTIVSAIAHLHEHLGQSIAYARMNGVVPPWTAEEQKAEKEKK